MATVRAPHCPELDEHRRLADIRADVQGLSVEGLDDCRRSPLADVDSQVLRAERTRPPKHRAEDEEKRSSIYESQAHVIIKREAGPSESNSIRPRRSSRAQSRALSRSSSVPRAGVEPQCR